MFKRKGIRVPREKWLRSIPVRLVEDYEIDENGNVVLLVELVEKGLFSRILRMLSIIPPPKFKRIILDKMGSRVWLMCDGKHSIDDIVRALVRETGLSRRNIELAVYNYINTLLIKGLIELRIPE